MTTVNRLGELERAIMDVLWDTDTSLTVREVSARLTERDLAHTTVMTVLDRLAKRASPGGSAMGAPGVTAPPLPARLT